jgi:hypothetical protein
MATVISVNPVGIVPGGGLSPDGRFLRVSHEARLAATSVVAPGFFADAGQR